MSSLEKLVAQKETNWQHNADLLNARYTSIYIYYLYSHMYICMYYIYIYRYRYRYSNTCINIYTYRMSTLRGLQHSNHDSWATAMADLPCPSTVHGPAELRDLLKRFVTRLLRTQPETTAQPNAFCSQPKTKHVPA